MRPSRVLACLAVVAVLCACGSSSSSSASGGGGTSTSSSAPGGGGTSSSPAACQFTSDSVRPTGTVEVQPPDQAAHPITAPVTLPCYSFVRVKDSGKADATFVTFSSHSVCELRQEAGSSSLAVLWTREPVPADYLFRLAAGRVGCTFYQPLRRVDLCGVGTMSVQGVAAITAQCNQDPRFLVVVLAGLVLVTDAKGPMLLHSEQELTFDSVTNETTVTSVVTSLDDMAVFTAQVKEMSLAPIPQTITFTSPAPQTGRPPGTYQVSAAGGASGNAVVLTIDSSSTSACSISGITENFTNDGAVSSGTVTYTSAGTCTIDANQAGNPLYQAALQQQQAVQVVSPIS